MLSPKTTIACLPVAGPDNPYQNLMMAGLSEDSRLRAFNGADDRFWGIARTVISRRPRYLHFDWIASYYLRRWRWLTYLSVPFFCAQILLARGLGVRLVWTLHNILPHDAADLGVHRFCQRFLAQRCDWIRVFSETTIASAAQELRVSPALFRVVPEGDYTSCYPNMVTKEAARTQLNIPAAAKVLLYLGLVKPYKGVLELVKLFREISDRDHHRLLIVGKGKDAHYADQVKEAAGNNVVFVDRFIPETKLQYYYNAADAVVLPFARIENSGSAIMAMGFARPIIAPALGVLTERLSQQKQLLYHDQAELREIIRSFLYNPSSAADWQVLGRRNYEALKPRWTDFAVLFL